MERRLAQKQTASMASSLKLNLPEISSMDYFNGNLFIPTDLSPEVGELAVLRRLA